MYSDHLTGIVSLCCSMTVSRDCSTVSSDTSSHTTRCVVSSAVSLVISCTVLFGNWGIVALAVGGGALCGPVDPSEAMGVEGGG